MPTFMPLPRTPMLPCSRSTELTSNAVDVRGDAQARAVGDTLGPIADLAIGPALAETRSAVAPIGGAGFAVTWRIDATRRGGGITASAGAALAPEAGELRALLDQFGVDDVSLARAPNGLWVTFSDSGALVPVGAYRAPAAYLLPLEVTP